MTLVVGVPFYTRPGGSGFAVGLNDGYRGAEDVVSGGGVQIGPLGYDRINGHGLGFLGAYGRPCFGRLVEQPHAEDKNSEYGV